MQYVQEYLSKYGARKLEANAIVTTPDAARALCRDAIELYLGADALDRFEAKRQEIRDVVSEFRERTGLDDSIREAIRLIDEEE